MKPRRFMVLLVCILAVARAEIRVPEQPVVAVYLEFENAPSAISVDQMKRETASILKPAGLELLWRSGAHSGLQETFPHLVVVRFRGTCDSEPDLFGTYAPEARAAALGSTSISDGHVLPFSEVACDEVRRYLAPVTRGQRDGETTLGRALGRVVAHEMYHMLLEEPAHGKAGIARAYHRRDELTGPSFRFEAGDIARLRSSLSTPRIP